MPNESSDISTETAENRIFIIRGHKVIFDKDLAELYGVTTKRLNEQVKRNQKRFPSDFMFRLTPQETQLLQGNLRSQFATLKQGMRSQNATASKRNVRYQPYAFTEHGALMAANVLNSERAITMSIYVIRAFVRLREIFTVNQILEERLIDIEKTLFNHDARLREVFKKIRPLLRKIRTDAVGFNLTTRQIGKIG